MEWYSVAIRNLKKKRMCIYILEFVENANRANNFLVSIVDRLFKTERKMKLFVVWYVMLGLASKNVTRAPSCRSRCCPVECASWAWVGADSWRPRRSPSCCPSRTSGAPTRQCRSRALWCTRSAAWPCPRTCGRCCGDWARISSTF